MFMKSDKNMKYKSKNVNDTNKLAGILAKYVNGGDIILLNGDLGAGNTTFVKGFASHSGVKENVTSPTFTLLKTYKANRFNIVHVDAYRLDGDFFDELDDYLNDKNVIFIEWSNCLNNQDILEDNLSITIKYVSKNQRLFEIEAHGNRYESILSEIIKIV